MTPRSDLPAWLDVSLIRAPNPGPLTLSGTNTWVVGRAPAWVVDPGPDLADHLDAVAAAVAARGGAGGIAVTHEHADHHAGTSSLLERLGLRVAVVGAVEGGDAPRDGEQVGPLRALALPGHCRGHHGFVLDVPGGVAVFTGDAVLGEGSVFVSGDMAGYLQALTRLRALGARVLCPGHGPLVEDPGPHLTAYIEHRRERERQVLAALAAGAHDEAGLLAAVWGDLAPGRERAARATLKAHLDKLAAEGRLPGGRPG